MQERSYWSRFTRARSTRRRLLAGSIGAGAGLAALALAGCGGDDGAADGSGQAQQQGLLTPIKDRTADAVRGGKIGTNYNDVPSLDPTSSTNTGTRIIGAATFNRLFQTKPGVLKASEGEIIGDAAESYELSNDGLQLTIKLRKNLGTDPRPPVNGRKLDAEDIVASWKRWADKSSLRATLVNSLSPNSPIDSFTATDSSTVVVKLAFPSILVLGYLTDGFYFWITPKEADDKYDPRNESHGAGPWYLESYQQNAQYRMKRNPNYYDSKLPYFDEINVAALSESAALLAQFEAKAIDISSTLFGSGWVTNTNVVDIYKRHPEMTLFGVPGAGAGTHFRVGYADSSPFRDVRMRRGVSMAMNRDELAEYSTNAQKLTQQGLPTEPRWGAHMSTTYPQYVDPRDKDFGANATYFKFNAAEAKKLLAASGHENTPFEVLAHNFSRQSQVDAEVLAEQLKSVGFKANVRVADFNAEFLPNVVRSRGDFLGMGVLGINTAFSAEAYLYTNYHTTPESTTVRKGDFPELTAIADSILKEPDQKKRNVLIKDWSNRAAEDMPSIPVGAVAASYHLAWPWIANVGVFRIWQGATATNVEVFKNYWYDKSKAS